MLFQYTAMLIGTAIADIRRGIQTHTMELNVIFANFIAKVAGRTLSDAVGFVEAEICFLARTAVNAAVRDSAKGTAQTLHTVFFDFSANDR